MSASDLVMCLQGQAESQATELAGLSESLQGSQAELNAARKLLEAAHADGKAQSARQQGLQEQVSSSSHQWSQP